MPAPCLSVDLLGFLSPIAPELCSSGGEGWLGTRHLACDSAALPLVLIMFFVGDLGLQLFHHFSYSDISTALISCGTQCRILFPIQTYAFLLIHAMNRTNRLLAPLYPGFHKKVTAN